MPEFAGRFRLSIALRLRLRAMEHCSAAASSILFCGLDVRFPCVGMWSLVCEGEADSA